MAHRFGGFSPWLSGFKAETSRQGGVVVPRCSAHGSCETISQNKPLLCAGDLTQWFHCFPHKCEVLSLIPPNKTAFPDAGRGLPHVSAAGRAEAVGVMLPTPLPAEETRPREVKQFAKVGAREIRGRSRDRDS